MPVCSIILPFVQTNGHQPCMEPPHAEGKLSSSCPQKKTIVCLLPIPGNAFLCLCLFPQCNVRIGRQHRHWLGVSNTGLHRAVEKEAASLPGGGGRGGGNWTHDEQVFKLLQRSLSILYPPICQELIDQLHTPTAVSGFIALRCKVSDKSNMSETHDVINVRCRPIQTNVSKDTRIADIHGNSLTKYHFPDAFLVSKVSMLP